MIRTPQEGLVGSFLGRYTTPSQRCQRQGGHAVYRKLHGKTLAYQLFKYLHRNGFLDRCPATCMQQRHKTTNPKVMLDGPVNRTDMEDYGKCCQNLMHAPRQGCRAEMALAGHLQNIESTHLRQGRPKQRQICRRQSRTVSAAASCYHCRRCSLISAVDK